MTRVNETPEEREKRLAKDRERYHAKRANETPEEREARLAKRRAKAREYAQQRRANETPEEREKRLQYNREYGAWYRKLGKTRKKHELVQYTWIKNRRASGTLEERKK